MDHKQSIATALSPKAEALNTLSDVLAALSKEAKREPSCPDRVAALAQAVSALSPLVLTAGLRTDRTRS